MLAQYLERTPNALDIKDRIGPELSIDRTVNFLARLHEFGLLPETKRQEVSAEICELTISAVDGSVFYDDEVRSLLTSEEFSELADRFDREIAGCLDKVVHDWEFDWSTSNPADHMHQLADQLDHYANYVENTKGASSSLVGQIQRIRERAAEIAEEDNPIDHSERRVTATAKGIDAGADIFDDVDE